METTSIVLPSALTAANSKKLLSNCRSALTKGVLHLDGSSLTSMDYSADAFFALLAELSEKTGNKLVLEHFSPEIKQHLQNLRKMAPPEKPQRETNNILEMMGGAGFSLLKEVFEVLVLLFTAIYWTLVGPFDKGKIHFGGITKQMFKSGSEAMGICFLFVGLICLTMALQSSVMLNAVGGGSYLASGLGFLIFAEIGPLLTTIILALQT